ATWMSRIRRSFHHSLQMGSERTLHEGGDPAAVARVQGDLRGIAVDGGEPSPGPGAVLLVEIPPRQLAGPLPARHPARHRFPHVSGDGAEAETGPGEQAHHAAAFAGAGRYRAGGGHRVVDRKSTRLNSSHVKISYAVFCLK